MSMIGNVGRSPPVLDAMQLTLLVCEASTGLYPAIFLRKMHNRRRNREKET
eukprot:CAMPEP_0180653966 /NCGR_PEP_ID=MMETSP1037_2-20121125/54413_1 /TAXON_ID=632150 /ORGANISM="Azadinium spinosum, Strain 3D9" /LENGTH=50 /DNA_ID=CAMNT_0022680143 /DNA_START=318 /DNA_END=470 /DNA_ORIENTATION=+